MESIYLDCASTTPLDPRVLEKMQMCLAPKGFFGNSSSTHQYGQRASYVIEEARAQIATFLNCDPNNIIWTSGATESNNLALKGAAGLLKNKGKHIVTMQTEHKAVLETCKHLEKNGYAVTYLAPEQTGILDIEKLKAAIRPDTGLVSIMHVNNETGVIQDIAKIAQLTSSLKILLHVDAAQSPGKLSIDLNKIPIDLLSLCAHKVYGPKGIGALFLRSPQLFNIEPLLHGGGHEHGMRSGTLPTHQIAGMGEAFRIAHQEYLSDTQNIIQLRERFINGLQGLDNLFLNVDLDHTVPHILNLRIERISADTILDQLPQICASRSSACQSNNNHGSFVLHAMGLSPEKANSSLRFSFGRFTTQSEIDSAITLMNVQIKFLQSTLPSNIEN